MINLLKTGLCRRSYSKVVESSFAAVSDVFEGATIAVGGFGFCGNPLNLIHAVHEKGVGDLTVISNNPGCQHYGLGALLHDRRVKKMYASYTGDSQVFRD